MNPNTDAQQTAHELGSVNALIKFAHEDERPEHIRNYLLGRVSPQHRELVETFQAVANSK